MHKPHKLVALIWTNCSDVAAFALSRQGATTMRDRLESWRPVDDILFRLPEEKADRALLEMGTLLRALDDVEGIGEELSRRGDPTYGFVLKPDGTHEGLYFRDMTNKILHARGFRWGDDAEFGPVVHCIGNDPERWIEAQIRIERLLGLCSEIVIG